MKPLQDYINDMAEEHGRAKAARLCAEQFGKSLSNIYSMASKGDVYVQRSPDGTLLLRVIGSCGHTS